MLNLYEIVSANTKASTRLRRALWNWLRHTHYEHTEMEPVLISSKSCSMLFAKGPQPAVYDEAA